LDSDLSLVSDEGMIKLGAKLENPYSVKNMQIAWDSLKIRNGRASDEIVVEPTHYYVKFNPETEEELDILNGDSSLILYSYPLDYELEGGGHFYHDPTVPLDQPTPQYCAVNKDYIFSEEVDYEILEELFIPDDFSDDSSENGRIEDENLIDELVDISLVLTNNYDSTIHQSDSDPNGRTSGSGSWRPGGYVEVWDDHIGGRSENITILERWERTTNCNICINQFCSNEENFNECYGFTSFQDACSRFPNGCDVPIYRTEVIRINGSFVPVHDVEVRARRWFTTHIGITDTRGYYSADGTFKNPANYSIRWQKYHFSIRSGNFGQAEHNGPKKYGNWNVKYGNDRATSVNDKQQYYALIFQAARDYYYGHRFGLRSPPRNDGLSPQTKIAAHLDDKGKDSHAAQYARSGGLLPTVYIREYGLSADHVYAVTAHELAHLAHWEMDRGTFIKLANDAWALPTDNTEDESAAAVIESWATGVEWVFAMERYTNQFNTHVANYNYQDGNQRRRIPPFNESEDEIIYNSLVIDLIDDINQRFIREDSELPLDRVSGFEISEIESALRGADSWNQWKFNTSLINQRNSFSLEVYELFENWF